jgi:cellulose synthase (UDP-forming)
MTLQALTLAQLGILLLATFLLARWVPRHPKWRPLVIALNLFVTVRYLWWRGTETLNWEGGWGTAASLAVYVAELYGFCVVLHHYAIATRSTDRRSTPPDAGFSPTVDLLVTTYNESVDILTRTIVGCQAIDYPNLRIHVLDDGRRLAVAALCRDLGVHYITRDNNAGAKAGNINNALARTSAEFVATLDADHVPVSSFLKETLGYFRDEHVAQVQTAHHFYNPDLFQDRLRTQEYIANEQDMFFRIVQPGRDVYNSSFYCGSGAVFRRAALDEIGGVPMTTVTEDLHTSLLLHSRGWKTVYVNRNLSAGLAPESFEAYVTQRRRWARGTFQVMLRRGGLFLRGLTAWQRVNYFATLWYWFYGFPRILYLIAPVLYLLLGIRPLVLRDVSQLLTFYLPHLLISITAFQLVNRQMRHIFWSDIYESSISVPVAVTALAFPLSPGRVHFAVTPKGAAAGDATHKAWRLGWPLWALSALVLISLLRGLFQLLVSGTGDDATLINVFWAGYNLVVLVFGLLLLRQPPQQRHAVRLAREHACRISFDNTTLDEVTADLSETGVSVRLDKVHVLPERLEVSLTSREGRHVTLHGRLVRCDVKDGEVTAAISFVDRTPDQHRKLIELMYSAPDSWTESPPSAMSAPLHLGRIVRSIVAVLSPRRALHRLSPRFACDLPVTITDAAGRIASGRAVDVGFTGMAVRVLDAAFPVGTRAGVTVSWNATERSIFSGLVVSVRNAAMGRQLIGIEFVKLGARQRNELERHLVGDDSTVVAEKKIS